MQSLDFYWLKSLFVLITIAQTDELNLTSIQKNITLTSMFSGLTCIREFPKVLACQFLYDIMVFTRKCRSK